jgi:hypothetical protein
LRDVFLPIALQHLFPVVCFSSPTPPRSIATTARLGIRIPTQNRAAVPSHRSYDRASAPKCQRIVTSAISLNGDGQQSRWLSRFWEYSAEWGVPLNIGASWERH